MSFIPKHGSIVSPSRYLGTATWEDAPHLSATERAALIGSIPPWQRGARTKGIPQLGAGAIYPVPDEDLLVDPFPIPPWWPRGYSMDVGWNRTAALWGAHDRETDILYLTDEYYRGEAEPAVHASGVKARGAWMTGCIDPASRGRSQIDGQRIITLYQDEGLHLVLAANALEAGLVTCWQMLSAGRVRVFRNLECWLREKRLYRRDDSGKPAGEDHLMDCFRYMVLSGFRHFMVQPSTLQRRTTQAQTDYDPFGGD